MMAVAEELEAYRAAFDTFARGRVEPAWLRELRSTAITRFTEGGFPTTGDEDWRQTSVAAIARTSFRRAQAGDDGVPAGEEKAFPGPRAVFVNGHFSPTLSSAGSRMPEGVEVRSLRAPIHEKRTPNPTRTAHGTTTASNPRPKLIRA